MTRSGPQSAPFQKKDSMYTYTPYVISHFRNRASTLLVGAVWAALVSLVFLWAGPQASPLAMAFVVASSVTWIAGGRAAGLWLRSSGRRRGPAAPAAGGAERIALLVCVCNDLDEAAVIRSSRQDVPVDVIQLDDSTDAGVRARVDGLAAARGWQVIRREVRSGFKAGNLNAGIARLRGRYDAYLICDSDVVLDAGVARVCGSELADPTVAVAQASPAASVGKPRFARYFGPLLATHLAFDLLGHPRSDPSAPGFIGLSVLQLLIVAALVAVLFVALRPLENNPLPLWDGGFVAGPGPRSATVGALLCVAGAATLASVAWGLKDQGLYCTAVMLVALVAARALATGAPADTEASPAATVPAARG